MKNSPLIVIVGPTASGKTSLAIKLAKKFNGEIICADSRTVYRGMDIGTAKPTIKEQAGVPHWGLDIVEPNQRFTAAEFKKYANQKIEEIRKRGHVPFLVGGSGLYIDAVLFDYQFGAPADYKIRQKLEVLSVVELQEYCNSNNIQMPSNHNNKRHLIRAIEQKGLNKARRNEPIDNTYIFGIETASEELRNRISARATNMFADKVIQEAKSLGEEYGWDNEAMTGNIYPLCRACIAGDIDLEEAKYKFIVQDWRLVKKQLTWFRRNKFIEWLSLSAAEKHIHTLLDSEH